MKITAQEVAHVVGGQLQGDPSLVITGAAGLSEAGPSDVSFLGNAKYASSLSSSRAGLLLLRPGEQSFGKAHIVVDDPQRAFGRFLVEIAREKNPRPAAGIHPTAVISQLAVLKENVSIGPFVVIEDDAVIGSGAVIYAHVYIGRGACIDGDTIIYPHVTVREECRLGKRCIIHAGAVIGADGFGFVPSKTGLEKVPQIGIVELGDDVEIGANTTIDRATTGVTRIGAGTKIDNLVQIAHNVQIGEHCILVAQVGIAGSAKIGNRVTFGGQSGTAGHITVADGTVVAARGGVAGDIRKGEVVSGFPARPHREELKIQAMLSRLPALYKQLKDLIKKD